MNSTTPVAVSSASERQMLGKFSSDSTLAEVRKSVRLPKFLLALSLYALSWAVVFTAALQLPSLEDISCFTILGDKHRILEKAPSPKIVVVGGSNLLFGLDGELIEHAFNRKVVDMGLCIMFPLPYLLEEVKDSVRPGDIVVLSAEYSSYSREYERPLVMADILDGYPPAIQWILRSNACSWEDKGKILFHLRTLGLQKLEYAFKHMRQIATHRCKWSYGKPNPGLAILNASNLNSCGDLVWHLDKKVSPNAMESKVLIQVPKHVDEHITSEVNAFDQFCRAKGAQVVLIPPPVPTVMYLKSKQGIDSVISEARQKLTVPVLANADRYTFPEKQIYGGHYHLDRVGRQIRTERMIEDLRNVVNPPKAH